MNTEINGDNHITDENQEDSSKSDGGKLRRGIYLIPNLFTLAALFSGFYAMIMATKGEFSLSAIAIFVAIVLDGLDGRVARLMHSQSEFGAQLDSLSDMVSFGIAPSLVMYIWVLHSLGHLGWCVAFIFTSCGALRLARFNTHIADTVEISTKYFIGLAIPVPAGFIASLILTCQEFGIHGGVLPYVVAVLAVVLGLLEVSMVKYHSFKAMGTQGRVPFYFILLAMLLIVLIAYDPPIVLLSLAVIYVLTGPIGWVWSKRNHGDILKNKTKN